MYLGRLSQRRLRTRFSSQTALFLKASNLKPDYFNRLFEGSLQEITIACGSASLDREPCLSDQLYNVIASPAMAAASASTTSGVILGMLSSGTDTRR